VKASSVPAPHREVARDCCAMTRQVDIAGRHALVKSLEFCREAPPIGLDDQPDRLRRRNDALTWTHSHNTHLIFTAGH